MILVTSFDRPVKGGSTLKEGCEFKDFIKNRVKYLSLRSGEDVNNSTASQVSKIA